MGKAVLLSTHGTENFKSSLISILISRWLWMARPVSQSNLNSILQAQGLIMNKFIWAAWARVFDNLVLLMLADSTVPLVTAP